MSTYFTYKIAYNFSWFQSWKWTPKLVFMLYYDAQIMEKVCMCVCARFTAYPEIWTGIDIKSEDWIVDPNWTCLCFCNELTQNPRPELHQLALMTVL